MMEWDRLVGEIWVGIVDWRVRVSVVYVWVRLYQFVVFLRDMYVVPIQPL